MEVRNSELLTDSAFPTEMTLRQDQIFPALTDCEIARISRFGALQRYPEGARLFAAGQRGPGMFVVLKGTVRISQRSGLGRVVPILRQGRGQAGASGPALIGAPDTPEILRLENFLRRNGQPHHVVDAAQDPAAAALVEQYGATAADMLAVCPDGSVLLNPSEEALARCLGVLDTMPGVFAVGDVRSGSVKRVGGAIGEGAAAVALIHQYVSAVAQNTRPGAVQPS